MEFAQLGDQAINLAHVTRVCFLTLEVNRPGQPPTRPAAEVFFVDGKSHTFHDRDAEALRAIVGRLTPPA
jgi:hypothetical protein